MLLPAAHCWRQNVFITYGSHLDLRGLWEESQDVSVFCGKGLGLGSTAFPFSVSISSLGVLVAPISWPHVHLVLKAQSLEWPVLGQRVEFPLKTLESLSRWLQIYFHCSKLYGTATKIQKIQLKIQAKDLNRHLSKGHIHMDNKHVKRFLASLAIRIMQAKTTLR